MTSLKKFIHILLGLVIIKPDILVIKKLYVIVKWLLFLNFTFRGNNG